MQGRLNPQARIRGALTCHSEKMKTYSMHLLRQFTLSLTERTDSIMASCWGIDRYEQTHRRCLYGTCHSEGNITAATLNHKTTREVNVAGRKMQTDTRRHLGETHGRGGGAGSECKMNEGGQLEQSRGWPWIKID